MAGRLARIWQPTSNFNVTPSIMYQQQDKNDDSTYWPAYSNPGAGQFNTATPERVGGPDTYYLPALKMQWDLGSTQLISNSSYFHRNRSRLPGHGLRPRLLAEPLPETLVTGRSAPPEATEPAR